MCTFIFPTFNWRFWSPRSLRDHPCSAENTQKSLVSDEMTNLSYFLFPMLFLLYSAWKDDMLLLDSAPPEPQASESAAHGTVTFMDANVGDKNSKFSGSIDATRMESMIQDVPLMNFFERPVSIASFEWSPGAPDIDLDVNPWEDFWNDNDVVKRRSNFRLMQCRMHVKITLNGNAFYYGRLIASYNPMWRYDDFTRVRNFVEPDLVGLSQKPHLYLDPTTSGGGELALPFYWHENACDLIFPAVGDMGTINIRTLNPLKHANGATDPITVNVYAWATDVKLSVPTQAEPQADEYGTGPISKPAGALATMMSKLVLPPWLQPYALATQIGASAVSKISSVFGYSRTPVIDPCVFRPVGKGSWANSNLPDDIHKLSLDIKQELTIDSRVDGLDGQDELGILSIAQHESYFTQFPWIIGKGTETLLWNTVVSPTTAYRIHGAGDEAEHHLTAAAFAALPFKYWRGTMRYRFQVVCSAYHRGRIKIVYDPWTTNVPSIYNQAYTTVVDITDKTDFSIDVGWGQTTSWMPRSEMTNPEVLNFDVAPLAFYDPVSSYGNGTLSVYVVNELSVPNSTVNNDISINVFVSVGDDFEVAAPNAEYLSRCRLSTAGSAAAFSPLRGSAPGELLPDPQADESNDQVDGQMDSDEVMPIDTLAGYTNPTSPMKLVHFGETFSSFRPLLKRYMMHEFIPLTNLAGTMDFVQFQRPVMPFEPGFTASATGASYLPVAVTGGNYVRGHMTHLKYLSSAFCGWKGGIRYAVDTSQLACCDRSLLFAATGYSNCVPENKTIIINPAAPADLYNNFKSVTGFEGGTVHQPNLNPVMTIEIPFYSRYRFAPTRLYTDFNSSTDYAPCWKIGAVYNGLTAPGFLTSYCAAGDDFTCSFFVGAPPMNIEAIMP
nr:MAG: hypothetical protein 2 [Salisharnavirus sp.]